MYRLPVTPAFEWDVVFVEIHDILKSLYSNYFNYYHLIKIVNLAKLNNYYHIINRTCDRSQTEAEPNLLKPSLPQVLFQIRPRSYLLNNYVVIIIKQDVSS